MIKPLKCADCGKPLDNHRPFIDISVHSVGEYNYRENVHFALCELHYNIWLKRIKEFMNELPSAKEDK